METKNNEAAPAASAEPIYGQREEEAGRKIKASGLLDEAEILREAARRAEAVQGNKIIARLGNTLAQAAPVASQPAQSEQQTIK